MTRTGSPGARRGGRITSGGACDGRARRRDGRANRPRAARWRHRTTERPPNPRILPLPRPRRRERERVPTRSRTSVGRRERRPRRARTVLAAELRRARSQARRRARAQARRGALAGAAAARAAGAGAGAAFSPGLTKRTRMPAADASADSTTSVTRACWSLSSIFRTSEVPTGSGSPKTTKAPASVRSRTCGDRPTTTPPYRTSVALSTVRLHLHGLRRDRG